MEKLPGSFKSDSQIKKLLCNLRIDLIVPLHEKILKEFEEKAENTKSGKGPNIADVFIQIRVNNFVQVFCTSLNGNTYGTKYGLPIDQSAGLG